MKTNATTIPFQPPTNPIASPFAMKMPVDPRPLLLPPQAGLSDKIYGITRPFFTLIPALWFGVEAIKELFFTAKREDVKVMSCIDDCRKNVLPSKQYLNMHGSMFLGAGICYGIESLKHFFSNEFGKIFESLAKVGNAFFFFANLLALEENIRLYEYACKLDQTPAEDHKTNTFWLKQSAIWGILSNLGYIAFICVSALSSSASMALIIGVIAAFSGAIKIIADFIDWIKNKPVADAVKA